jgi:hypothetical protein
VVDARFWVDVGGWRRVVGGCGKLAQGCWWLRVVMGGRCTVVDGCGWSAQVCGWLGVVGAGFWVVGAGVCPNRTLIRTYMIVYCITEQNRADKEDIR